METDDAAMISHAELTSEIAVYLDYEADLLDRLDLQEWLKLWLPSGRYIVPIDRETSDHANTLNHIYDDHAMRAQRVERLLSGLALSASPPTRTVRSISRMRILASRDDRHTVSSAMIIVGYKRQTKFLVAANVMHELQRDGEGYRIGEKSVMLIDSDEPLGDMSFIL